MRAVLDGGPSDHRPFICDFEGDGLLAFRAVTFNAAKHDARQLADVFDKINRLDVGVWLLQEIKRKIVRRDPIRALKRLGLRAVYARPEFAVAWDPTLWQHVRHYRVRMSPTEYWTTNYALVVVLRHRETAELVKFASMHPPAHVQAPKHPSFAKVMKVVREVADKWRKIARRNHKRIEACCFGMDDNVDDTKGWEPKGGWGFMDAEPLEQVQPPKPTRGSRRIDVFRTRGLKVA